MHRYFASGLSIASELTLPGLEPTTPTDVPDLVFRLGEVPETLAGAEHCGPTWQIEGARFLLRIPSVARFLIREGREVIAQCEGSTPVSDLAVFLSGSVFGILLHQRRRLVLHGSAVVVNGRAVLFCGPSGAGKSTLAAILGERGYALGADDICAISLDHNGPRMWADGRRLKLWRESIDALAWTERQANPVRQRIEKFYVRPDSSVSGAIPIGAIYALREARPPHSPGIEHPNVVDAARTLLRNAYRPLLVRQLQQRPLYFQAGSQLATLGLVHTLTRPLDFALTDRTTAWLEAHWRALGLMEAAA